MRISRIFLFRKLRLQSLEIERKITWSYNRSSSALRRKKKNCEDEVITLDETTEDEKKVNCADNSIEFIRYRKASKRKRVIDTLIKKKSELRKRRSFTKFPKDVKQLTKVNRRLSRGLNEPKPKDLKINNVGYQFNPMQKPILNFAVNGPVNFTAKRKRPIVIDGSNVAIGSVQLYFVVWQFWPQDGVA